MTNIDKQALRERYSEKPAPTCHICGAVMTIQRASAGSVIYGCTGRIDGDGEGYKFEAGRNFADDHYARSRVTEYSPGGDHEVLTLLDELEAAGKRIASNERVMRAVVEAASIRGIRPFEVIECDPPTLEDNAEACGDAMSARIRELEANPPKPHHNGLMKMSNELVQARNRIAELEARTVTVQLPADNAAESESPEDDATAWFDEGWNARGKADKEALIAAGIGVKGE